MNMEVNGTLEIREGNDSVKLTGTACTQSKFIQHLIDLRQDQKSKDLGISMIYERELESFQRVSFQRALDLHDGYGTRAAKYLGITYDTFLKYCDRLGIERRRRKAKTSVSPVAKKHILSERDL